MLSIEYDVPAVMRDGTVLRADVYRPAGKGPWPTLVCRLPYGKSGTSQPRMVDPVRLAQAGFMVVLQDTRGRFTSDGDWTPWHDESDDGFDTVRWAAGLHGSNGVVGMFGGSYLGNTQWQAALTQPPELAAIAPAITFADPLDGLYTRGGAFELGLALPWALVQGIDTLRRRFSGDPAEMAAAVGAIVREIDGLADTGNRELPVGRSPVIARHAIRDIGFQNHLEAPAAPLPHRITGRFDEVTIPTLHVAGWFDIFSQGTLDAYMAMRDAGKPATLVIGPWTHTSTTPQVGDVNFGLAASGDLVGFRGSITDLHAQWFTENLPSATTTHPSEDASRPTSALPAVLVFVMGLNEWRAEETWPLERAVDTNWYLGPRHTLVIDPGEATTDVDTFRHDPADPVPTTGGAILLSSEWRAGPLDQADVEARDDVLCYTSQPLTEDMEVTGRVRAVLHADTDAESTDWVVRLCDVNPAGRSLLVVDGIARTSESGVVEIDLWSTSYVFKRGHRLRVQVASSCFPRWSRNLGFQDSDLGSTWCVANQTVHRGGATPSHITLPIVPTT